jgi:sulfoxide reductase heme-binding subunit YedZ
LTPTRSPLGGTAGGIRSRLAPADAWLKRVRLVKPIVFAASLIPLAYLAWMAAANDLGANPIEKIEDFFGKWALRFLMFTLAVTPARRLFGWNALVRYRRMLGLFAFFYACLHVSSYIGLDMYFDVGDIVDDVIDRLWITIGMATFLMLVALAVTSTKGWIRRLGGARWNRLHQLTYVVAVTGSIHYLLSVKKDIEEPLLFGAIFGAIFFLRWWTSRRAFQMTAVAPARAEVQRRAGAA